MASLLYHSIGVNSQTFIFKFFIFIKKEEFRDFFNGFGYGLHLFFPRIWTWIWIQFLDAECRRHWRLSNWDCVISFFSVRPLWDNIQLINLLETMWHTYGQFENMGCSAATWYLSVLQIYSCRSVQIYYRSADLGLADSSRTANAFCGHNRDV